MTARRYKVVCYSRDVITIPLVEVNQAKKLGSLDKANWNRRTDFRKSKEAGRALPKKVCIVSKT